MYDCKLCGSNTMECLRCELTFGDGSLSIVYVCSACREKYSDEDLYKKVVRKILN